MGYSGSIYQQLGDSPATSVFIERKGDGESCLVYPEIYHFNKKTEVTNKTIAEPKSGCKKIIPTTIPITMQYK